MIRDETVSMTLLMVACICLGGFSSNHWALAQTLAGPEAAGKWTSIQNCLGNVCGYRRTLDHRIDFGSDGIVSAGIRGIVRVPGSRHRRLLVCDRRDHARALVNGIP